MCTQCNDGIIDLSVDPECGACWHYNNLMDAYTGDVEMYAKAQWLLEYHQKWSHQEYRRAAS